jgi:tetratricopeptide (TPR) repeat protein
MQAKGIGSRIEKDEWAEATNILRAERANLNNVVEYASKKRDAEILSNLMKSLAVACIEIGYWEDADRLLNTTESVLHMNSSDMARTITLKAVMARRRGNSHEAWEAWQRVYATYEKNNDATGMLNSRIEIVSQAIEEARLEEAHLLIQNLVQENEETSHPISVSLRIITLHAQLLFANGKVTEAQLQADKAFCMMQSHLHLPHRVWLVGAFYLCPIYRSIKAWNEVGFLVSKGIEKALEARQLFGLGSIFTEAGYLYLATSTVLTAIQAFWVSQEIHKELGSRFAHESEQTFITMQERYQHLPEVRLWLETKKNHSWKDIVTTKLLPAHDLHTFLH